MDDREREQLARIATQELSVARRGLEERIGAVFASHSALGRLHSGATIRVSVRAMEEVGQAFLEDLLSKTKAVSVDPQAFEMLSITVGEFLDLCSDEQLPSITRMGSGRLGSPRNESIEGAARELFDEMRAEIEGRLAIAAFDFDASGPPPASAPPTPPVLPSPKKGGRPPAEFWDDMWAAIATALYDGSLTPKTQSHVERAMADWIEANGYSAADSTVRGRARRLWDRLAAADE